MPRNPEWWETIFKPLPRGVRRLDPWPEGYRIVVRVRTVNRVDAILLARTFKAWPIHTHTGKQWPTTVLAYTPEEAADLWNAGDDWVATNLQPPADYSGIVINPTDELERRIKGRFEWRDPEDTKFFERPREDR